jgi:hypothetical protein
MPTYRIHKRTPAAAFVAHKTAIDEMLARLTAFSAEHFNTDPCNLSWADIGPIARISVLLREISDFAFNENTWDMKNRRRTMGLLDNLDYDTRFDLVVTHAWQTWTHNGLGLDADMVDETTKTVEATASNEYMDNMDNMEWLAATLKRLGHSREV